MVERGGRGEVATGQSPSWSFQAGFRRSRGTRPAGEIGGLSIGTRYIYLNDDNVAFSLGYVFLAEEFDPGQGLVDYSFDSFRVSDLEDTPASVRPPPTSTPIPLAGSSEVPR